MGKSSEAAVFRSFINSMKEKTKEMNEDNQKCKSGYYYCYESEKCKRIPKGYRIGYGGILDKNNDSTEDYPESESGSESVSEEGLRDWFGKSKSKGKKGKPGWVNVVTGGTCASDTPGEGVPKCVSSAKRASMTKAQRLSAARRKKAADPNQQLKSGSTSPTYVSTDKPKKRKKMNEESDAKGKGSGTKDACYFKVKSRYSVWPSAYASGALVKCRKVGAANWGNKSESIDLISNDPLSEEMGIRYCPKCEKDETRDECKYGPKYFDMFSIPSKLSQNQIKFSIAQVHPANESKEYKQIKEDHKEIARGKKKDDEGYMARSEFDTIMKAVSLLRKNIKKGNQQLPAWVQSKITKATDYIDTASDYLDSDETNVDEACWDGYVAKGMKKKGKKMVPNCVPEQLSFKINNTEHNTAKRTAKIEKLTKSPNKHESEAALRRLSGPSLPLADSYTHKSFSQFMSEASAAWQRKEGKNPEGGLNSAGVASYRRQNPGSKLQTAVTTKPSKLKPGSKDAKRRKSFCARMGGMPGPMKDEKGRPTRKALSLKKWNC